jgi:glycosyltransferase involved in cell wall biosynthesis
VAPLVLHLLPLDLSRGAQTYARELRVGLDGADARHRTVTLFDSPGGALQPDHALGVAPGRLRRGGLDPRAVLALWRVLRAQRPDVVVAHGSEPLKYAVLAGVPRSKLVAYKIGAGHSSLTGIRGLVYRTLLGRAGTVAAVSEAAADEAREFGVAAERLRVIPNGRDPAGYRPREPGDRTAGAAVRLVWVGHLDAAKRPLRFVALVRALREPAGGVAITATIAGDGPLLGAVRAEAGSAGVEVPGNVDDVPSLLAASDVLVLTSAPNEGMPGVLIEAGMAGLPVVTTDVPGAADVVSKGVTGFIVGVDDFDALVRATRNLLGDPGLRDQLGAAARTRCETRFSLEASLQGWRELLAVLARGQQRPGT